MKDILSLEESGILLVENSALPNIDVGQDFFFCQQEVCIALVTFYLTPRCQTINV